MEIGFYIRSDRISTRYSSWSTQSVYMRGNSNYWTYLNHSHPSDTRTSQDIFSVLSISTSMTYILAGHHMSLVLPSNSNIVPLTNAITRVSKCEHKQLLKQSQTAGPSTFQHTSKAISYWLTNHTKLIKITHPQQVVQKSGAADNLFSFD